MTTTNTTDETYVLFKKDPPQQVFVLNSDDDTRSAALEQANKLIEHCEGNVSIIEEFQEKGYSEAFTKLIFDSLSINGDPSEEDADAGTEDAATTGGASAASKKKKKKKKNNKNNSAAVAAPVVEDAPTAVETEEAVEEQTIEEEKPAVEEATEDKKEEAALVEEKKEDIPAQNDPEPAAIEQETKIEEIRPVSQPEKKENLSHKGSEPEEQVQPPPITTPTPAPETTKATPTKKQAPLTSAAAVASTPSRTNAPTTSTLSPVSTKSYLADSAKAWGGSGSHASTQSSAAVLPDQKTFSYAELKGTRLIKYCHNVVVCSCCVCILRGTQLEKILSVCIKYFFFPSVYQCCPVCRDACGEWHRYDKERSLPER